MLNVLALSLVLPAHALNPSRVYFQRPDKYGLTYTETKVRTSDGSSLATWVVAAKTKTTRLVLVAHDGEGNMADVLPLVDQLSLTAHVVMFDWRGFGESSEFEIDNNMYIYPHFQDDLRAMIDYCRKSAADTSVVGLGMAAGLALGIGWQSEGVSTIVADSPYLSLEDLDARLFAAGSSVKVPVDDMDPDLEPIYALLNAPTGEKDVLLLVDNQDPILDVRDLQTLVKLAPDAVEKAVYVEQSTGATRDGRIVDALAE